MEITYSDQKIEEFMQERKVLPNDWRNQLYKTKNYLLRVKTETHSALGLDNTTSTR